MADPASRINLDAPRFDQSTYDGRARHFFITTNPLNIFATPAKLEKAKELVESYRSGNEPPGTSIDAVWKAKHLYDSAYHPDTKEKMFILGRMSAQVPMNMTITGCMLTFYKTTPQVVFWQWANQSFNAIVNYTNRSGDSSISAQHLGASYVAATTAATGSALLLNRAVKNLPVLMGRFVPFAAVAMANCVNIPCMRSKELMEGIPVVTENDEPVGNSVTAAKKAIPQVVTSRIAMAVPCMVLPPLIMANLEKGKFLRRFPLMNAPIQVALVGIVLSVATPMCCALFPQRSSLTVSNLEPELQEKLRSMGGTHTRVYFNKGL